MGIIMFLKKQYFQKLRALKDDVTVNQKYYFFIKIQVDLLFLNLSPMLNSNAYMLR